MSHTLTAHPVGDMYTGQCECGWLVSVMSLDQIALNYSIHLIEREKRCLKMT
jgi:hypothetical protein